MITDAHNTRYCSPIGRSTAPARIPIVRLYEISQSRAKSGGVNLQQHGHRQTMFPRLQFPPFPSPSPTIHSSLMSPSRDQDLSVRRADPHPRSSRLIVRRSIRFAQAPVESAEFHVSGGPRLIVASITEKFYSSLLNVRRTNGRTPMSAIRRFDRGSDRRAQDRGASSITVRITFD